MQHVSRFTDKSLLETLKRQQIKQLFSLLWVSITKPQKEAGMSILAVITLVLVSPFMAISLLPTLPHEEKDDEKPIVRWRE